MLTVTDPDGVELRKAIRATVVVPVLFAGVSILLSQTAALFAVFGAFALLVFADFGGTPSRKARAYLLTTAFGAVAVLTGTMAETHVAIAAVSLLAVTFAVRFIGCFGGYVAAGSSPVLLAFVLAVMVPPMGAHADRLAGWLIGGLVATVAAAVAPVSLRRRVGEGLAARCHDVARQVRARVGGREAADVDPSDIERLREQLTRLAHRPMGPSRRYRAYVGLLDAVERSAVLAPLVHQPGGDDPTGDETRALADAITSTLDATAVHLVGGPATDLGPLDAAREAHRDALLTALRSPDDDAGARSADRSFALRVLATLSTAAAIDAALARGEEPPPTDLPADDIPGGTDAALRRAMRTLRFHLDPSSVRFRNSARAAVALAAALLVAHLGDFAHGFWVVLGALLVLRASAFDTGATAIQALGGTLLGFVVAAPFAWLTVETPWALWAGLVVATFLAAWAPGAVGLWMGQAAFTLFVVVMFNLVEPDGWVTAVDRVVAVGTGAAISVAVGVLFWPRGAEAVFSRAVAEHYRAAREVMAVSAARFLGTPLGAASRHRAHDQLALTREHLDEAFEDLVDDRRAHLDLARRTAMMTPPALVSLADGNLSRLGDQGFASPAGSPVCEPLAAHAFEVETGFTAVADALESGVAPQWRPPSPTGIDAAAAAVDVDERPLLGRIWLDDWLAVLGQSLGTAIEPVEQTSSELDRPWWR